MRTPLLILQVQLLFVIYLFSPPFIGFKMVPRHFRFLAVPIPFFQLCVSYVPRVFYCALPLRITCTQSQQKNLVNATFYTDCVKLKIGSALGVSVNAIVRRTISSREKLVGKHIQQSNSIVSVQFHN